MTPATIRELKAVRRWLRDRARRADHASSSEPNLALKWQAWGDRDACNDAADYIDRKLKKLSRGAAKGGK